MWLKINLFNDVDWQNGADCIGFKGVCSFTSPETRHEDKSVCGIELCGSTKRFWPLNSQSHPYACPLIYRIPTAHPSVLLMFLSIALLFLCFCWFSRDTYSHLLLFHLTIIIGLLKRNTTEDDYNPSHQTCSKLMLDYSFHSVFFFLFIKHLL